MAYINDTDWFPNVRNPDYVCGINGRCLLRRQDGHCVVLVSGIVLTQYACTDRMAEAHAMVSLVEQGWADQTEVARAFACSARTVRRHQRRFEEGGLGALGRTTGYPAGRARLSDERRRLVQRLKAEGVDQREIARRMGVSEKAIRKLLRRLGWKATAPTQANLPLDGAETADPNLSASAPPGAWSLPTAPLKSADPNLSALGSVTQEESIHSHDTDPTDRSADRLLARLGLLEDAPPLFGSAAYSDGFRTRFRRETGQWSDASRTPFRLKSDSVPADIGQF